MITKIKTNNREEWLALRRQYIGGSDAAAVVGLNAYSSPFALWAEKTGRAPGFTGNLATEVGTFLEEFVAQKFAAETGKKVRRCNLSFVNSDYPFAIANIDREIVGEDAGLEIKTTDSLNLRKFNNGEFPANYYVQIMHYLAVTGKKRWYLAVLIGNRELKIFTIERDDAEIRALMDAEREFWAFVAQDIAPAVDGSKSTTSAINGIYESNAGSVTDLTACAADLDMFFALGQQISELEQLRDAAANRIKAYMQENEAGEYANYRVTWKTQPRRTFDAKRFAADNPQIELDAYYKTSNSRVFRAICK